jgi:DNA-binding transcriptional MerR regulator
MAEENKSKLWTVHVVASWYGISGQSLREWEKSGSLKIKVSRTPGGHRRYSIENVREISTLLGREVPPAALE